VKRDVLVGSRFVSGIMLTSRGEKVIVLLAVLLLFGGSYALGWSKGRVEGADIALTVGSRRGSWDPQWFDIGHWVSYSLYGVLLLVLSASLGYIAIRSRRSTKEQMGHELLD